MGRAIIRQGTLIDAEVDPLVVDDRNNPDQYCGRQLCCASVGSINPCGARTRLVCRFAMGSCPIVSWQRPRSQFQPSGARSPQNGALPHRPARACRASLRASRQLPRWVVTGLSSGRRLSPIMPNTQAHTRRWASTFHVWLRRLRESSSPARAEGVHHGSRVGPFTHSGCGAEPTTAVNHLFAKQSLAGGPRPHPLRIKPLIDTLACREEADADKFEGLEDAVARVDDDHVRIAATNSEKRAHGQ